MAAAKGNQHAAVLTDPKERQKAYESYCAHIADGYPKEAWYYRNGEHRCGWLTMDKIIEKYPEDLSPLLMEEAKSLRYKGWFDLGRGLAKGSVKGNPSPQTWSTIMRNMFKWDQEQKDTTKEEEKLKTLDKLADAISSMRKQ